MESLFKLILTFPTWNKIKKKSNDQRDLLVISNMGLKIVSRSTKTLKPTTWQKWTLIKLILNWVNCFDRSDMKIFSTSPLLQGMECTFKSHNAFYWMNLINIADSTSCIQLKLQSGSGQTSSKMDTLLLFLHLVVKHFRIKFIATV